MESIQLEDLYRERDQIRRLACALVGESDADDIVQEAMTAALSREAPPLHWGRWLSGVTRHLSWRRSTERRARSWELERHARTEGWGDGHESSPDELVAEVEAKNALERAVLDLDEPYRSVLLWRFYEDLSIEEISRRSGTPRSTTRTRIERGLARLRARMNSERGPEWRMALVPLLLRTPAETTLVGAAAASGVMLMTFSMFKWIIAAIGAAALVAFLANLHDSGPVPDGRLDVGVLREESPELASIDTVVGPGALEAEARTLAAPPSPEQAEALAQPAASSFDSRLEDRESGLALAGVELDVKISHTINAFIFKRSRSYEDTVVTDGDGRFELPTPDDPKTGETSGRQAEVSAQHDGPIKVYCDSSQDADGTWIFTPRVDFACRVQLPVPLTAAQRAAATFGLSIADGAVGGPVGVRFKPAAAFEQELTLLVPRSTLSREWNQGESVGTIVIATTPNGPSFTATFETLPLFDDDPLEAELSNTVIHSVRVVDAATGEPVEGASVNVAPATAKYAWGAESVVGLTDATGTTELIGVPTADAVLNVQRLGFSKYRASLQANAGATTEVLLEPETGIRPVEVTVRSARGAAPLVVWCIARSADGHTVSRESGQPEPSGDGWVFRSTLETVPAERCFIEVELLGNAYGLDRHWLLEPEESSLTIELGEAREVLPVLVDAPEGVLFEYSQRLDSGRLYVSDHVGPGTVREAPVDGTSVTWTIRAEGHVPIVGTEADWTVEAEAERKVLKLNAAFERGWGATVRAIRIGSAEDGRGGTLPYHLRTHEPVAGVVLFDGPDGREIGVTDERGFAVIRAGQPLEAFWYRSNGEVRGQSIFENVSDYEVRLK